ncbi:DedA family protein [Nigerium massiliense]|uniref:DedA family protein n=1 Tax=Nigerium massiliense TaxID=1522317 RepID=UPI0009079D59|nr:DedA family protein [Nigerium massiliense]
MFDNIVQWVVNLMQTIGGPGVFLAILLENVFPPIPSEVILPLAGFTAAQPNPPYSLPIAIVWATLGSLLGAYLLYWLGAAFGADRLRRIADKIPLVDGNDVTKSVDWFHRHGPAAILFGRLIPGIRSLISIPAGVDRMPLLRFSLFTALGSAVWNTILATAGYLLGDQWSKVGDVVNQYSNVVYVILILLLVALLVWLVRRAIVRRKKGDADGDGAGGESRRDDGGRGAHAAGDQEL